MSDPKYLRDDIGSLLGHVVEECGEVLAAIGKTQRWGLDSYNPELPPAERETNRKWLQRELADLEFTIGRLRTAIDHNLALRFDGAASKEDGRG